GRRGVSARRPSSAAPRSANDGLAARRYLRDDQPVVGPGLERHASAHTYTAGAASRIRTAATSFMAARTARGRGRGTALSTAAGGAAKTALILGTANPDGGFHCLRPA